MKFSMPMKVLVATAAAVFSVTAHAGPTLDAVKQRGYLQCGFSTGIPGFSAPDSRGEWTGLDVDVCRAVAAAVFGDASKYKPNPLSAQQRFTALQSGEVDFLARTTTLTLARDISLGLREVGVNFYDSQGVIVRKELGVSSATELDGATVCVQPGTTGELNLTDWFRSNSIAFKPVVLEKYDENIRAFMSGRCDAFTADKSQLASIRAGLDDPEAFVILPEDFSKEPLGTFVRQGDEEWFGIVRWVLNAMLEAEEYGITSQNVDEMLNSTNPNVQRILGGTPGLVKPLGLDDRWAYNIVKQVGNYGESFERNVGTQSRMKLARGLNAQWREGGLMYGWPVR